MKFVPACIAIALFPVSANAAAVHQTAVVHDGQTVSLQYEARTQTRLEQRGIGPRASGVCRWKATTVVERKAMGADGRDIAALNRVVSERRVRSGLQGGLCESLREREAESLAGSDAALRTHVAAVAAADVADLRAELAELAAGSGISKPAH